MPTATPPHDTAPHPYSSLTPDAVLDALDAVGVHGDGRLVALGSYENRVYQVMQDDAPPVVAKFYRPGRWTDAQILEEHAFVRALDDAEVPSVPPREIGGRTLHTHAGFRYAVYDKCGGRPPELDRDDVLEWIGRFLGRLHAVGARERFVHRPAIDVAEFGEAPRAFLLARGFVPPDLIDAWSAASDLALDAVRRAFDRAGDIARIRLHGDVHAGNVLWIADGPMRGPHFVDFDDARNGPAIQDLWMMLSGDRESMEHQMRRVLAGYEQFREFDRAELALVEPLRTLRLLHYSAWIAARWDDPAFPAAFPWFGTTRYWQDRILELREQLGAMDEPPIEVR
ncbi:MAG: serine/threonine protein kinase [Burkholderiales bacterium]|nr:serine/threonine protein kinase [Burkholderiales bacterium]MCC7115496.1 serine/threonine protein kinase [Burkholderiales bacterium]